MDSGILNTDAACLPCGHPSLNKVCNSYFPYGCLKDEVFSIATSTHQIAYVPLKMDLAKAQEGFYGARYVLAAVPKQNYAKIASVAQSLFYFDNPGHTGSTLKCLGIEYEVGGTLGGLRRNVKPTEKGFSLEYVRSSLSLDKVVPPSKTVPDLGRIRFSTVLSEGVNACCREGFKISLTIEANGGAWGLAVNERAAPPETINVGGDMVSMTLDRMIFTNEFMPTPFTITVQSAKKETFVTRLAKPFPMQSERLWADVFIPDKNSTSNNTLPSLYTVARNCLPIHDRKVVKPYLLAYLNSDNPTRNYNFEPTNLSKKDSWVKIYAFLSMVQQAIELARQAGNDSPWYQRLRGYSLHNKPFESFYYSFVGNSSELWILLYIAGNSSSNAVGGLGPVKPLVLETSGSQFKFTLQQTEQFLFMFDKKAGNVNDSCWLPLYRDCGSFSKGFCTGRASDSSNTRCSTAFNRMTESIQDSLIQEYCGNNPKSTDCACYTRYNDETFNYLIDKHGKQIVTMDSCWWKPCLSRNNKMLLTKNDNVECNTTKTCFNLMWLTNASDMDLSKFTQVATCTDGKDGDKGVEDEWELTNTEAVISFASYLPFVFFLLCILGISAYVIFARRNEKIYSM